MKIQRNTTALFFLLLLVAVSGTGGQTEKSNKNRVTKAKEVVITLVRWPYT